MRAELIFSLMDDGSDGNKPPKDQPKLRAACGSFHRAYNSPTNKSSGLARRFAVHKRGRRLCDIQASEQRGMPFWKPNRRVDLSAVGLEVKN